MPRKEGMDRSGACKSGMESKGFKTVLVGQWKVRCRKFGAESLLWSKVEMQVERNGSMFLGFSRAKDGMEGFWSGQK